MTGPAAGWEAEHDPIALLRIAERVLGELDYRRVAAGWCELVRPLLRSEYLRVLDWLDRTAAGRPATDLVRLRIDIIHAQTWPDRAASAGLFDPWRAGAYRPAGEHYRHALGEVGRAVALGWAVNRVGPAPRDVHVDHPWHAAFNGVCDQARAAQAEIVRCLLSNRLSRIAFDSDWRTSTTVALARAMVDRRDFAPMPVLADALQDAGCEDEHVLAHCRGPGPHVRGCWVIEAVLGRA